MFSGVAEVSVGSPCKAITSVRGDQSESRFIVGTCTLEDSNQLLLLRYDSDLNELRQDAFLDHSLGGAVHGLCDSPSDATLVLTAPEESTQVTLWKIPQEAIRTDQLEYEEQNETDGGAAPSHSMDQLLTLDHSGSDNNTVASMVWRGGGLEEDSSLETPVLTLDCSGKLRQWDVATGALARSIESIPSSSEASMPALPPPNVAWDPHNVTMAAVTVGKGVQIVDWRADHSLASMVDTSFKGHRYGVTDVDYNPNSPYILATGGQDGLLKFWDLRNAKRPLLVARGGHHHWIRRVDYNPFHDQLVLSSGSDSLVNLWRVSSISSAPLILEDEDSSETSAANVRISRYEHADSVYDIAWGASDAWIYASIGYEGRVVLNQVPSKEKYRILL